LAAVRQIAQPGWGTLQLSLFIVVYERGLVSGGESVDQSLCDARLQAIVRLDD
jgi:hypothetical protein